MAKEDAMRAPVDLKPTGDHAAAGQITG